MNEKSETKEMMRDKTPSFFITFVKVTGAMKYGEERNESKTLLASFVNT